MRILLTAYPHSLIFHCTICLIPQLINSCYFWIHLRPECHLIPYHPFVDSLHDTLHAIFPRFHPFRNPFVHIITQILPISIYFRKSRNRFYPY